LIYEHTFSVLLLAAVEEEGCMIYIDEAGCNISISAIAKVFEFVVVLRQL